MTACCRHRAATWVECALATRAMLAAAVEVPGVGRVSVVNVHLSAGLDPTGAGAVAVRGRQAEELRRLCAELSASSDCVVAMGDFNAGPEADALSYRALTEAGFLDAWASAPDGEGRRGPGHTWDPSNPLNAGGVHAGCPAQRCDHVFLVGRGFAFTDCRVAAAGALDLGGGVASTASDHYGVAATVAKSFAS